MQVPVLDPQQRSYEKKVLLCPLGVCLVSRWINQALIFSSFKL